MKIIKFLRKPYLSIIIATLVLYASCHQYESPILEDSRMFDYSQFDSAKKIMQEQDYTSFDRMVFDHIDLESITSSEKLTILNNINKPFGETPAIKTDVLDYFYNDGEEIFEKGIKEHILTLKDKELMHSFASDMVSVGFEKAIQNFEQNVKLLKVTDLEFDKYNQFANQISIVNRVMVDVDADEEGGGWACAFAIAGYTLATIAVGTACVPNPTTPLTCPLAIARAAVAYGSMIAACSD